MLSIYNTIQIYIYIYIRNISVYKQKITYDICDKCHIYIYKILGILNISCILYLIYIYTIYYVYHEFIIFF